MQKYVVIACFLINNKGVECVLVQKERPEWQKGLYNFIGGKVEYGEEPIDAAIREFQEEARITLTKEDLFRNGTIFFDEGEVAIYTVTLDGYFKELNSTGFSSFLSDGELVFSKSAADVIISGNTLQNMKAMLPMCYFGLKFDIIDNNVSQRGETHEFSIRVRRQNLC